MPPPMPSRAAVEPMLADGLTLEESVGIAFLASPELQLSLEQLEIARSELVAASTPPNPVAIVGVRETGGSFSAFYPDESISIGVLQNVLALLNMPDRRAVALHELERARFVAAEQITHSGRAGRGGLARLHRGAAHRGAARALRPRRHARRRHHHRAGRERQRLYAAGGRGRAQWPVHRRGRGDHALRSIPPPRARSSASCWAWAAGATTGARASCRRCRRAIPTAALEAAAMRQRFDVQAAAKAVDARLRVLACSAASAGSARSTSACSGTRPSAARPSPGRMRWSKSRCSTSARRSCWPPMPNCARRCASSSGRSSRRARRSARTSGDAATRALLEQYERHVLPNQQAMAVGLGTVGEPGQPDRLRLRLEALSAEEEQVGLLRDYWRARSALALPLATGPGRRAAALGCCSPESMRAAPSPGLVHVAVLVQCNCASMRQRFRFPRLCQRPRCRKCEHACARSQSIQ